MSIDLDGGSAGAGDLGVIQTVNVEDFLYAFSLSVLTGDTTSRSCGRFVIHMV